jgi:adenylate cyclase
MSRKLGFSNLVALVTGKYRSPRRENRIFMFISLGGIDGIIRKTGNMELHNFINDFIHDISDTILIYKGKIVHYMEDEIVVSWRIKSGIKNANCIRTYFHLCHEIVGHFEEYHSKYGLLPKPKCAIHTGTAIKAEIGEIKSEISYFGDVINTTSRILHEGVKKGIDILVSQSVMEIIQIPTYFKIQARGSFTLRGKKNSISLFSLHISKE